MLDWFNNKRKRFATAVLLAIGGLFFIPYTATWLSNIANWMIPMVNIPIGWIIAGVSFWLAWMMYNGQF